MPYPVCHVYIALHYAANPNYITGSIFPDVTHLLIQDKKHKLMSPFIKALGKTKEHKEFIKGIKLHVAIDKHLHKFYIYPKADILAKEFNLHSSTAEGYIEIALDRLIDRQHPEIARIIKSSIKSVSTKKLALYLSASTKMPLKKMKKALKSARLVAGFKKPYKLRALILKALILRKYSRLRVREFKLLKSRKIAKQAEALIKKDYEQAIKQAIRTIKLTKTSPLF